MISKSKKSLRREILEKRKALFKEEKIKWDREIARNLAEMKEFVEAKDVLCYVSTDDEVDTRQIINFSLSQEKNVYVPKVVSKEKMEFYKINSLSELRKGYFGISEPDTGNEKFENGDAICVVPGLCFDKEGNRLGYGGGFYDRFLQNKKMITVSLAYSSFILKKINCDEYDVKMDYIVTQSGVLNCKNMQ